MHRESLLESEFSEKVPLGSVSSSPLSSGSYLCLKTILRVVDLVLEGSSVSPFDQFALLCSPLLPYIGFALALGLFLHAMQGWKTEE